MSTILIVENQPLRLHLAALVKTAGFEAVQTRNADEALAVLERRSDIALLITNVAMDGTMDGVALAHAVSSRWPSIKVIVVTGNPRLSESDLPKKCLFFAKPYHDEEILFEIRALIGASPG
jgi:DNA-binding NtrC family response regulator